MNKKILISLSVIGAVAAIVVGGTIAYFSDTETSTGNTFTAGSIDLKIDNTSYVTDEYGHLVFSADTSWELDDLTNQLFFDFSDLKPGDIGEDTVSIHVDNNDAWACVTMDLTKNDDVTCTEPEMADDSSCDEGETPPDNDLEDGDLAQELYFIFWLDDGDNVLENDEYAAGEGILMQGPAIDVLGGVTYTIADSQESITEGPLVGTSTYYIGKAWCFGTLTPTPLSQDQSNEFGPDERGPGVTCDGTEVNNAAQSDQVMGDITFYAVQSRNNSEFVCGQ